MLQTMQNIRYPAFVYKNRKLACDGRSLTEIARSTGTPCYVYSQSRIIENYEGLKSAIEGVNRSLICYALKANSNLSILKLLGEINCGAECVSANEIKRALLSGVPTRKIIFDGVGKTTEELQYALDVQVSIAVFFTLTQNS